MRCWSIQLKKLSLVVARLKRKRKMMRGTFKRKKMKKRMKTKRKMRIWMMKRKKTSLVI
jgi:hypothetical protein